MTLNVSSDPNSQKLFISLYDCLAVKTQDHQDVETAETSRVLALFQDSRGEVCDALLCTCVFLQLMRHLRPKADHV